MLGKDHRFHVWLINHHVDDGKLGVGKVGGHQVQHVAKSKASHDDRVGTGFSQTAKSLFALGFGLHFQLFIGAAGFFGPTLCAVKRRFVERFVELATKVEDDGGFGHHHARRQRQSSRRTQQVFQ